MYMGMVPLIIQRRGSIESKRRFVQSVSRGMRDVFASSWCVVESGTCGPEFYVPGVEGGFTAVAVAGPDGFYREVVLHTGSREREVNMEAFAKAALKLLLDCLSETIGTPANTAASKL
eukprot:TRINITY_DN15463_c0_g1_i1.p2 TRINITY_DN15463_c0_g1~~TRINITY_DN15463_c0_g1_i1.p2  ORF type:complete len:118 (-),score=18.31 TRINITY_DN15463_c0_g1_i1:84-437(-)